MEITPLNELTPQNAVALFSRAASPGTGLFLVTGQARSGKTTIQLAMARSLEGRGATVTWMAPTDLLDTWGLQRPPSWRFVPVGRTADEWRNALASIPPGPANVVVAHELTTENTRPLFDAASRFRVTAITDTPLFGIDVAYTLRGWQIDMGSEIPPLRCLWSQVLLPRLCRACRRPVTLDPVLASEFNAGGHELLEAWMEAGCEKCGGSGLQGWVAAYEVVVLDEGTREAVKRAIRDNDAAILPATHHLSLPAVARELLLAGEIGVETYRQEVSRNPLLRAERALARERDLGRRTRELFRRFVDDAVIDQFVAAPNFGNALEGRRAEATCLFCDIRGFTSFAEKHDPREVFRILNEIIDEIIAVVIRHGGMVDKIIGDSVMALFGLPVAQPDHAQRAVACGRAIQERIGQISRENPSRIALKVGIGINSGELAAGCLGNSQRMDYTVLGDVVNTAARLEARAAPGQILMGARTRALIADNVLVRDLGDAMLKGKSEAVRVFELEI